MSALKNAHYLAFIRSGARGHLLAAPEVQQELLHRVLHADPLERPSVLLSSPHVLLCCRESTRKTALKPRGRHSQKQTSPWKAPKVAAESLIRPGPAHRYRKSRKEPERGPAVAATSPPPRSPGPAVPCSAGRAPPRPSLRPPRLLTERSESEPGEPGAECAGEQLPSLE